MEENLNKDAVKGEIKKDEVKKDEIKADKVKSEKLEVSGGVAPVKIDPEKIKELIKNKPIDTGVVCKYGVKIPKPVATPLYGIREPEKPPLPIIVKKPEGKNEE